MKLLREKGILIRNLADLTMVVDHNSSVLAATCKKISRRVTLLGIGYGIAIGIRLSEQDLKINKLETEIEELRADILKRGYTSP